MQKQTKENKKRELLQSFYNKINLGLSVRQESKSDNKQSKSFEKGIQLIDHPRTQIKNTENVDTNHIQNILISKFNFDSKIEAKSENKILNNHDNKIELFKFSENALNEENATSINMLNYTNSYKNLINVNSLSVLNLNSNNKNHISLHSNSNKKFSACKKSPSSINREIFYDENNIDFTHISKNLNIENVKFNLNKALKNDSSEKIKNCNYDKDQNEHKIHNDNRGYNKQINENKYSINNYDLFDSNISCTDKYDSKNEYNKKFRLINFNESKEVSCSRDSSLIDANINITVNNSQISEANETITNQNQNNFLKINKLNRQDKKAKCSEVPPKYTIASYRNKINPLKLAIESKSNSPMRQASNKDFDDTMNVITESSLRNFNLNFNNNYNNNNSNVNSNNGTLTNIFSNYNINTNTNNNNVSNANSIISYNNNSTYIKNNIRDKYKKDGQKNDNNSSIFKSEDLRISKMENLLLHNVNYNLNTNANNNNSLYYNHSSNNNSNNSLLNFNNTLTNNTILHKEDSNLNFQNNNKINYNINTTNNNNDSFSKNNIKFKVNKKNSNNLNTNSLSDFLNFNNNQNIYSPLSTGSNLNHKKLLLAANLPGLNSCEKRQNKTYIHYDSKSERILNAFTGALTPSHQNSFNLNVFVSRNDSHGLLHFNKNQNNIVNDLVDNDNNNIENDIDKFNCYLKKKIRDEEQIEKNVDTFKQKLEHHDFNDNELNNFNAITHIKNNNILIDNDKNNIQHNLDFNRASNISIFEDNDLNEDCVEYQKNLKYNTYDLFIVKEIELVFYNM